jgi:guanyl-specific ribonuclease Sa
MRGLRLKERAAETSIADLEGTRAAEEVRRHEQDQAGSNAVRAGSIRRRAADVVQAIFMGGPYRT